MDKKAFTLVELLAVIAILAILVIIALPNVLDMYKEAKINSFENEVKNTYGTVRSQYLLDSMSSGIGKTIAYTNAENSVQGVDVVKSLNLTGSSNYKYCILVDPDGRILSVRITDGTHSYVKHADDIEIKDINIKLDNEVELESNISDELCLVSNNTNGSDNSSNSPRYLYSIGEYDIGNTLVVNNTFVFDNFESASASFYNSDVVLAYIVDDNNLITEMYIAFKTNGTIYYLKGKDPSAYSNNKAVLNTAFPGNCSTTNQNADEEYGCNGTDHTGFADSDGNINVVDNASRLFCYINLNNAECE